MEIKIIVRLYFAATGVAAVSGTIAQAERIWKEQNLHLLLVGMWNESVTLAVSRMLDVDKPHDPGVLLLRTQGKWQHVSSQDLCANVGGSIAVGAAQMSIS